MGDVAERKLWDEYMRYYEETDPRDQPRRMRRGSWCRPTSKWFTRLVVVSALVEAMESLDLHYPKVDQSIRAELQEARLALAAELPAKNGKKNGDKVNRKSAAKS